MKTMVKIKRVVSKTWEHTSGKKNRPRSIWRPLQCGVQKTSQVGTTFHASNAGNHQDL